MVTEVMQRDLDQLFETLPGPAKMTDLIIGAQRHQPVRTTQGIFQIALTTIIVTFTLYVGLSLIFCTAVGLRARHLRRANLARMIQAMRAIPGDADQEQGLLQAAPGPVAAIAGPEEDDHVLRRPVAEGAT